MFKYTPLVVVLVACQTDKSITVQNPTPKASIVSHDSGDVVLEGMATQFVGSVTDSNHTPDQLTTVWYVNGEIVCDDVIPDENGETTCELSLGLDDTEVTLAVRDAENARGEESIVVSIEPTEVPQAQIVSPTTDGVYYSDQLITFEGLVTDAEDDEEFLSAFWESNRDGELIDIDAEPNSTGQVLGYGNLSEGQHAIELHVEDSSGKETTETVVINVGPPNSAPLCAILSPTDGSAGPEGDVVTFTATASDDDVSSDWLTVQWSSDKDGTIGNSIPTTDGDIVFTYSGLSVNSHVITMQVADELGETCTKLVEYTVGTPPIITIDSPVNGNVVSAGNPMTFTATVSDAQDQSDEVALDWVLNGSSMSTQGATSSGTATFSNSSLSFGTYNLVVTATDTDGLTDSDQVNFTVNGLPTAPVVSINPIVPNTSDSLNVNIDTPSIDPEGVTPTYTYAWQLGGQTQTSYTSSSLPSSATSKGEQWTVVVTPNDGIADGVAGTANVVIGNTPPIVGSVTVTPLGGVYNDDVLTCSASVSDPDEIPTVSYEWTVGGSVVGNGSTLDLITTGAMPGDTVVCTVTATDSDLESDTGSGSQSVSNRIPSITATLSANGTNQNAELTCVGNATDPDGESPTVTYEWFNSTTSLGSSNPLQLNSTLAIGGDVIDCVATATDAMGGTDTATVSHTVTNTVPVISSVTVTPDPGTVGQDDLTCSVSASDADGDPLFYTYEWSDSTGVQQTTTLVSDTTDVFLSNGTTEDTWTCQVTPFDGTDYGVPQIDSVTVESGDCLGEGLVFGLDFNGGTVVDSSAIGHMVTAENSGPTLDRYSILNEAWNFQPNVNSRLVVAPSSDLVFTDAFSLSMFVRFNEPWSFHAESLIWKFPHPSTDGFHLSVDQNDSVYGPGMYQLAFSIGSIGLNATKILSYSEISDWFHVVATFEQGAASVYIDGQLIATDSSSSTIVDSLHELYIGGSSHPVSGAYNRDVDMVQIHNCALNVDEVEQLYIEDVDGDGVVDWEDCDATDPSIPTVNDQDCDGFTIAAGDCDDTDAAVYPFAGDVYGDGVDSDCDTLDCEATDYGSSYFAACPIELNWNDASSTCINNGYDGLATVLDASENNFLHSIQPLYSTSDYYWIGLNDIQNENSFQWTSGYSASYINWNTGEPNNVGNEDCVHIYGTDSISAPRWNDMPCLNEIYFVCEVR